MSTIVGSMKVLLGLDAAEFIDGFTKADAQATKFAASQKRNQASIDRQVKALQQQADMLGMSTREAKLFELAQKGATTQQLKAAESALAQAEAHQKLATASKLALSAVTALGLGALGAVVGFAKLTGYAGSFQDLAEETGGSAEEIASLAVAAATADVSITSVAAASNKLTKNLVGVDDESKAAGAALKALNLNIDDFKKLDPVAQYEAVSKALGTFADSSKKSAVAQALFGKSGAEQLKVMKALEEQGGRTSILTAQQIALADDYGDRQARNAAELKLYAAAVATQFIEPTNVLIAIARDAVKELTGAGDAVTALGVNKGVQAFAEAGGRSIAEFADYVKQSVKEISVLIDFAGALGTTLKQVGTLDFSGAKKTGEDFRDKYNLDFFGRKKPAKEAGDEAGKSFVDAYNTALAASKRATFAAADPRRTDIVDGKKTDSRPALAFNGPPDKEAANKYAAELKKTLDGQLKAIQEFAAQQKDGYDFANHYAEGAYQDGLVSLREFFDAQANLRDANLRSQLEASDKEIAALAAARDKTPKESDRIDLTNKIAEAEAKRAGAIQKYGQANTLAIQNETRAARQLADQYDDLRAAVLTGQDNTAAASKIRIDRQVREAEELIRKAGGDPAQAQTYRAQLEGVSALSEQQKLYNRLLDQQGRKEADILVDAELGGKGEMATLAALGESRQAAISQLGAMRDSARALADQLKTPEAQKFADDLALAFKKASAELDPLKAKFDTLFKDAGASALGDFFNGKTSFLGALKSFGSQIATTLNNSIAKEISDTAFGSGGIFSGAGGLLSKIFKGPQSGNVLGESAGVPDSGLGGLFKSAPTIDTTGVQASFSSLQTSGIEPVIEAFIRLAQNVDAAATTAKTTGVDPSSIKTTGEFSRFDRSQSGEASVADLFKKSDAAQTEASASAKDFGKQTASATADVLNFAAAAARGQSVLSLMPSIIQQIIAAASAASASGGSSGGGGSGIWGSLFSAAAGYFTGGSGSFAAYDSAGMATNTTGTSLPTSGGRAIGGAVSAGKKYGINERGRSEVFESGGRQWLVPLKDGSVKPDVNGKKFMDSPRSQALQPAVNNTYRSQSNRVTINVPAGTSYETANQIAVRTTRRLAVADKRLG